MQKENNITITAGQQAVLKRRKKLLLISVVLFLASLTQPCYCTTSNCGASFLAFLLGWAGMFSGGAAISWLANPLLLISWILMSRNIKPAAWFALAAWLIAASFLLFDGVPDNEGGQAHRIIAYKAGYWLWLAASGVMATGSFWLMVKERNSNAG